MTKIIKSYKSKKFLSIGLIGEWGSGKSSFLKKLEKELLKDEYIVLNINVWELGSHVNVIKELKVLLDNEILKNNIFMWIILTIEKFTNQNYFKLLSNYFELDKNSFSITLTSSIEDAKKQYSSIMSPDKITNFKNIYIPKQ